MTARTDLRLLPGAAAAWCAGLVGTRASAPTAAAGAVVLAVALAGVLLVAVLTAAPVRRSAPRTGARDRTVPRPGTRLRAVAPGAALALAVAGAVLVSALVQRAAHDPPVLREAVVAGDRVDARARVLAEPQVLAGGAGMPPRVRVDVVVEQLTTGGRAVAVAVPAVVLAPAGAATGSVVTWSGTPRAAEPGERAALVLVAREPPEVVAAPGGLHAWAGEVRAAAARLGAGLPGDAGALLPAVTVGDTAAVPADLRDAMRLAGLAHVMAVSGAHFTIVGGLLVAAAAAAGGPAPVRAGVVAAGGALLVLVVQPQPSVVRAAAMGALGLVGVLLGRRAAGPAALACAVVLLLVVDPWLAGEPGAALSVAATAGLVLLGPPLVRRWSGVCGRGVATVLAAPVAAQLGCLPVVLALWPTLSTWAVPANVAVAPAVAPATVLGLAAVLLAPVWPAGAAALAAAAGAACWWIGAVARVVAQAPGAGLAWAPGATGALCALVAAAAGARLLLVGRRAAPPGAGGAGG
ncbi:ComEC/Rec2 family competence protein [Cellulomonas oligotrophica]|uniref:Competence protein ComEC n=1 Tax=Cellulomonas oligotrophica TaxID=931536 RepID=A0A7Y9JWQ2_9CELL|nr:ComEC/Rec2 family competence protein [Cellulomonas oligotrophica]NYD85116.1 competence protein ComEC [Cellulomonas oligotrophica]GIG33820.1 hypothetical protein Col01nite_29790 [Cellulomonas oligotrophica]